MTPDEQSAIARLTDEQFRSRVSEILTRELGEAGYSRFLLIYSGEGQNYTRDRDQWLGGFTVEDIMKQIKERRERPA